ncbi:homeobox protein Hox-B3a-like [Mytilus trossulus]|uniref:homeobox protein Hox-B3a-like n=1 Tax=Mytilus trossulus TaxID=6551 RepID=UPI003005BFFE
MASIPMSFSIEELSKSSRVQTPIKSESVLYDLYQTPSVNQHSNYKFSTSLMSIEQHIQKKRKRSLVDSEDNISSPESRNSSSSSSYSDDSENHEQPTKKARTIFTNSQVFELERYYSICKYLAIEDRQVLSKRLKVCEVQIKWWFQNRRMKEKRQIKSFGYNESTELSKFVSVGRPNANIQSSMNQPSHQHGLHQNYSPLPPMFNPYMFGYGCLSPVMNPVQQYYNGLSPQPVQQYRL